MKTVWFGCISDSSTGLGHVSRCVALAEEFRVRRINTCFNHLSNLNLQGVKILEQSNFTTNCCCQGVSDLTVIDSYNVDFIAYCRNLTRNPAVLLVDDTSPIVHAEYYLQASPIVKWKPQNLKAQVFEFSSNPILREKFDFKFESAEYPESSFRLIISLGAINNFENILRILILAVEDLNIFESEILVILGTQSIPDLGFLSLKRKINFVEGAQDIAKVFNAFTFVISAAGVTAWELISMGVPGFLIAAADNQMTQAEYMTKHNLRKCLVYRSERQLKRELLMLFEDIQNVFLTQQQSIKNGRKEAVDWILQFVR